MATRTAAAVFEAWARRLQRWGARGLWLGVLWILLAPQVAEAHEFRPGHLYVVALDSDGVTDMSTRRWELRWHAPSYRAGGPAMVAPNYTLGSSGSRSGCQLIGALDLPAAQAGMSSRTELRCQGVESGLEATLELSGLRGSLAEVVLHIPGRAPRLLDARTPSFSLSALGSDPQDAASGGEFASLFVAGARHVLAGWDHLAFLLCFTLLIFGRPAQGEGTPAQASLPWRPLLLGVSAFSLAHALASVLVSVGLRPPPPPLEAAIALSIVVVAAELARGPQDPHGRARGSHWRSAMVFGLVHGLGFGSALAGSVGVNSELGASSSGWSVLLPSLVSFNLGVEFGQLLFVCACAFALTATRRYWGRAPAPLLLPYLVGTVAAAWSFERIAAMF